MDDCHDAIAHVSDAVGVGRGETASDAGFDAKHALEECRAADTDIGTAF